MLIKTEETPNPLTLKFIPGRIITESDGIEFKDINDAKNSPFAFNIMDIEGVKSVFLNTDFISVTKSEESEWSLLRPLILEVLLNYFSKHEKIFVEPSYKNDSFNIDDEVVKQIKELIETKVRPAVSMDGGDIVFDRFEDGIVYLRLYGACSGCPSSNQTLKSGIENMLRYYIPEVKEVKRVENSCNVA